MDLSVEVIIRAAVTIVGLTASLLRLRFTYEMVDALRQEQAELDVIASARQHCLEAWLMIVFWLVYLAGLVAVTLTPSTSRNVLEFLLRTASVSVLSVMTVMNYLFMVALARKREDQ